MSRRPDPDRKAAGPAAQGSSSPDLAAELAGSDAHTEHAGQRPDAQAADPREAESRALSTSNLVGSRQEHRPG